MRRLWLSFFLGMMGAASPPGLWAEAVRVVVDRRTDVLEGKAFGTVGAYEKLVGRIFFVFG
jgi:hypothetical protein